MKKILFCRKNNVIEKACVPTALIVLYMLVFGMVTLSTARLNAENFYLRGDKFAHWWTLGDPVIFRLDQGLFPKGSKNGTLVDRRPSARLPIDVRAIAGVVADSAGNFVARQDVTAEVFMSSGWQWKPKEPGFYTVQFFSLSESGASNALTEIITAKLDYSPKPNDPLFTNGSYSIAVLPSPTRPPARIPEMLGVSLGIPFKAWEWDMMLNNDSIQEAALAGFRSIRIFLEWDRIEPAEGKPEWELLDDFIVRAKQFGFESFIFTIVGTPRWASPFPEKDNILVHVPEYSTYAPVQLSHFSNFLHAAVTRYPFVTTWEIWNEPSMPRLSCYWSDTPENMVALMRTGYTAIKAGRPDAVVWFSGAYPSFYDRILELGGGAFFDRLSRHGQARVNASVFHQLERNRTVAEKAWINGEYHAVLTGSGAVDSDALPSEAVIAHDMLISFMRNLQMGAQQMIFFSMGNHFGAEREMFGAFRNAKKFVQFPGIFRRTPCPEARLSAVVWRNFIDCFSGTMVFKDEFQFMRGEQAAAHMSSELGDIILVWNTTDTPARLCKELAAAVAAKSRMCDWEGRRAGTGTLLVPHTVYFIKNPDAGAMQGWERANVLRSVRAKKEPELMHLVSGKYSEKRLFDDRHELLSPENVDWQNIDRYVSLDKKTKQDGFRARFAAGVHKSGFDLVVDVADKFFFQNTREAVWNGDSVQFAIDSFGKGLPEDRLELSLALLPDGSMSLRKEHMPIVGGDLPGRITLEMQQLRYGRAHAEKTARGIRYLVRIDPEDLFPYNHLPGQTLRFSILVNNNDGSGRAGYAEWGSGIGYSKDPSQYGDLTVSTGSGQVLSQRDLLTTIDEKSDSGTVEKLLDGDDGPRIRMTSTAGKSRKGAVYSSLAAVTPGAKYKVTFQMKGNVPLIIMAQCYDEKSRIRTDIGNGMPNPAAWSTFRGEIIVPIGRTKIAVWIFCWEKAGVFEIKDFSVHPAE